MPNSDRVRPRRGALLGGLLAVVVALTACTGPTQPKEYGDAYEANFMIGCTGVEPNEQGQFTDPTRGTVPYCECVYQQLVDTVPFDQVAAFEEQQSEEEAGQIVVPPNIQATYDRCKQSNPT